MEAEPQAQRVQREKARASSPHARGAEDRSTASQAAQASAFQGMSTVAPASVRAFERHATSSGREAANELTNGLKREILAASVHASLQRGAENRLAVGVDVHEPRAAANIVTKSLDDAFAGKDTRAIAQGVTGRSADGKRLDPPVEARLDRAKLLSWYADQVVSQGATLRVTPPSDVRASVLSATLAQASTAQTVAIQSRHNVAGETNKTVDAHEAYQRAHQEMVGANGYQVQAKAKGQLDAPHQVIARSSTLTHLAQFGQDLERDGATVDPRLQQLTAAKSGASGSKALGAWSPIFNPTTDANVEALGVAYQGTPPLSPSTAVIIAPSYRLAPHHPRQSVDILSPAEHQVFAAVVARNGAQVDVTKAPPREAQRAPRTLDVEYEVVGRSAASSEARQRAIEAPGLRAQPTMTSETLRSAGPLGQHERSAEFVTQAGMTARNVAMHAGLSRAFAIMDTSQLQERQAKILTASSVSDHHDLIRDLPKLGVAYVAEDMNRKREMVAKIATAQTARGAVVPWDDL